MGIALLILVIVLMIVFVVASYFVGKLQKNTTDSDAPSDLQSHILQEIHKIEKPPE